MINKNKVLLFTINFLLISFLSDTVLSQIQQPVQQWAVNYYGDNYTSGISVKLDNFN